MSQEAKRKAERIELLLTIHAYYKRRESRLKARGFATFPARTYGLACSEEKGTLNTDEGNDKSGNHGHGGRPGEIGGSAPSGGSAFDPAAERDKIKNGTYPANVVKGRQRKHTPGSREFEQNAAKMERESPGSKPSILKADAQELVDKYKGTGEIRTGRGSNTPIERIHSDKIIGNTWVVGRQTYIDTTAADIVYSNKGVHIVPVNDNSHKKGGGKDA
jgi:hypothetical protein